MIQYFRGLRSLYNVKAHGAGIYFATDTQEIIHNGLAFSGNVPEELLEKIEANENQLLILNGSSEGSIQKQITTAIDQFALQITDNGTIDTFKELLDYAANNGEELGKLVVELDSVKEQNETIVLQLENLESDLKTTEESLLLKIEENNIVIFNEVDTKIETAFSWEDIN